MSNFKLTEGCLEVIMNGGEVENPLVQVFGCKRMNTGTSERYRLILSDGRHSISYAMVTPGINEKIPVGGYPIKTILKITKYMTSTLQRSESSDLRVLLVMDMEMVASGTEVPDKIGDPVPLTRAEVNGMDRYGSGKTSIESSRDAPTSAKKMRMEQSTSNGRSEVTSMSSNTITHPISSLSPYQNKWVIKVRVTNKSPVRTWSNSKGEGKLFSMDVADASGEIRCTAFRDQVDKFYDRIEVDKVYFISNALLKTANKQYSTLNNDYELTFSHETTCVECEDADDVSVPQTKYNFVTFDKISEANPGTMVDVIGVAKSSSDVQTFTAKSTGRELRKRDVVLVDQSNTAITLTLWGADADSFDGSSNPVVVLKGARLGEFGGGKTLSTVSGSTLKLNPDLKEAYRIRGWYDDGGSEANATNLSAKAAGGSFNTPWLEFDDVEEQGLGQSDRGDYYQLVGTILMVRGENMVYKACPAETCNKKVVDLNNGLFKCEKCGTETANFKYRLLVNMNVADSSGNQWVSMFTEVAEVILGMTAQEVGQKVDEDPKAVEKITEQANFREFKMTLRTKMETYNDESRLKTVCVKAEPVNLEEYNSHLISMIQKLTQ